MRTIFFVASLILAFPVAVVAFYLGNFGVLTALCVYVTLSSLWIFATAFTGHADRS